MWSSSLLVGLLVAAVSPTAAFSTTSLAPPIRAAAVGLRSSSMAGGRRPGPSALSRPHLALSGADRGAFGSAWASGAASWRLGRLWGASGARRARGSRLGLRMGAEQGVQLGDGDLEKESKWLEDEITQWLDDEWIPREVHREIGIKTGEAYTKARKDGVNEVGNILMAVATDMMSFDFYEADVAAFDIANKVSDLLLQADGRDVCCTAKPYNMPSKEPASTATSVSVPDEVLAFEVPKTPFEKYQFLQQAMDGRVPAPVLNWAVLQTLGYTLAPGADGGMVYDASAVEESEWQRLYGPVPDFVDNTAASERLTDILVEKLEEKNKELDSLDSLIEALYGEAAVELARSEGDVDFMLREACVKWLHFVAGY